MIISIVLFLAILSILIWLFFKNYESRYKTTLQNEAIKTIQSAARTAVCPNCIRRHIDGVYVATSTANLVPVAIMIDNHPDARPQAGIDKANLVYEAEVEGGYTRYMAVFANNDSVSQIGPVRSARPYFIDWALEINAIYTHCGGSPEALVMLEQNDMTDLNEMYRGQYFWRATNRAAPHNILTSSENLNKFINNNKIAGSDYDSWQFKNDSPATSTTATSSVAINYSTGFKTAWLYNKEENNYTRYMNNELYLTSDNHQIIAKNIIIQYIPFKVVDEKLRLDMNDVGSGSAQICLDGTCRKGLWTKQNLATRTRFTYDNGDEVKFNAGTTWIEVMPPK